METDPTRTCQLLVGLADVVVLGLMPALVTRRWWCRWNVRRTGPQIRSTHYAFTAAYPAARKASSKSALNSTNVARSRLVPGNASRTVVTAIRAACPTG